MPRAKLHKTRYVGVRWTEAHDPAGKKYKKYVIIYRRPGNPHQIEETLPGFSLTPYKAHTIRAERIKGAKTNRERREEEEARRNAEKNRWTFSRLWDEYKETVPMKGIVYDENRYKNHIKPDLGDQTPEELNPLDLDRIRINLLKKKKLSPQTAKHVMALIRRLVNFGVRKGLCKGLDFPITMPSVNNERTEDLNPNELSRLLKALDKTEDVQIANLMRLILHTGMRKSEALRLKWEDIDFRTGFIHLRDRKAGGDTRIPMNDQARTVLKAHPRQSEWVFPGRGGNGPRKDVKRAVAKVKEEAGLPEGFRPLHGLRHFFASTLASNGIDLFTIQRLLGHRSAGTTARYSHLRDAAVCDASSLAGSLIEAQAAEGKEKEKKKKSKSRQTAG